MADERPRFVRGLSLAGAVALVVGNMVGTSVYTLPASVAAKVGPLGLVAWGLTAAAYLSVALVYASLGTRYPRTGGPYEFARRAFGDLAGFQTVWAYWLSAVIGNAAIVTSVVGYAAALSAPLAERTWLQFAVAQVALWGLCALNVVGVRKSAGVQIALMAGNVIPLIVLSLATLSAFEPANLRPFAPHGWGSLATGAALVVWAFSGIESATVPAEEVRSPDRTIARGTLIGYAIGTVAFLLSAAAVIGALPTAALASSPRPVALAVEHALGPAAGAIIAVVAVVAGTGTLNGWILMAGRIPVSAARDGLFFAKLGALHPRHGTPHVALIASTAISSAMLLLYFSRTLLQVFELIVLLSVLLTLIPHLYATMAALLSRRDRDRYDDRARRRALVTAPIAFAFVLFTIYGVGAEVALWGFLMLLAGLPVHVAFATASASSGRPPS